MRKCFTSTSVLYYLWYYVCSCPAHAHLPARRVGSGDETTLCMSNEHAEIYESQYAYMYDNEHAAYALCSGEVPVTLYSVSIQAERNAVDES